MQQNHLIDIRNITVSYPNAQKPILRDIDLTIDSKEITCVIGESGSGKSTLLNAVLQLPGRIKLNEGHVFFRGEELEKLRSGKQRSIRGTGIGVVFQEPGASLDPTRKIWKQFYDALHAHDSSVTKEDARKKASELLQNMEFKDPDRILDNCPAQLSGGMNQRVAIAVAMALEPAVLLADEPTSALDVTVQAQVVDELLQLRDRYGTAILLITHNLGVAAKLADRIAVMYGGRMVEYGSRNEILYHPAHPYTRALLEAIPKLDGKLPTGIPGRKPDTFPEEGCAFVSRCPYADENCSRMTMDRNEVSKEHWTLCKKEVQGLGNDT